MIKRTLLLIFSLLKLLQLSGQGNCIPASSSCLDAPLFCGFVLKSNTFNNDVQIGSGFASSCGIDPHNSVWFKIIPCDTILELVVQTTSSQTGDGLQVALYDACSPGSDIACNPGMDQGAGFPLPLTATVVSGHEYYLMVDGYTADVCDFRFDIIQGLNTDPPMPSSGGPFDGFITGPPTNQCAGVSSGSFTVNWPDCENWTGGAMVCAKDSCVCVHWTIPPGAVILGDPCAKTVFIDFSGCSPGGFLIRATPECACANPLCELCGPVCCPVNPATLPITISGLQLVVLPEIKVCNEDDFPDCVYGPDGVINYPMGWCDSIDIAHCKRIRQPYRIKPFIFANLGNIVFCDTAWVCGTPYTDPGPHEAVCTTATGCDSSVFFVLVKDPACIFNCTALNEPVPPGDSCHRAPFLCGNYLDHYCGSNTGLTNDTLGNVLLQNAGFIRFRPCFDSVSLRIGVSDCTPGSVGLRFDVLAGDCPAGVIPLVGNNIYQNEFTNLTFNNLSIDTNYTLVISGINNSECAFTIQPAFGVGTATPGSSTCTCTDGAVEGPDEICPGTIYTYTLNLPDCTVTSSPPIGGNGYFCMPPEACPVNTDTTILQWHIPEGTHYIGDSTGLTIQIMLDSSYFDLDTMRVDSVWVNWHTTPTGPPADSLYFCDCNGLNCTGIIKMKQVIIRHDIEYETCVLNCINPSCYVGNQTFTQPGNYQVDVNNCRRVKINILSDFFIPAPPILSPETICQGQSVQLTVQNPAPSFTYSWDNGAFGPSIVVFPNTTTVYSVVAVNNNNGCTSEGLTVVTVMPTTNVNLGEVGVVGCSQPCVVFMGNSYCQPGNYVIVTGLCDFTRFSIGFDPDIPTENLPPVTICAGDCFDFFGQSICTDSLATHVENCTRFVRQITVDPGVTTDLGVIGIISCAQPCFNHNGIDYCNSGTYTMPVGQCDHEIFEIGFKKDTLELGEVGIITCADSCISFEGVEYCQSGAFTTEDPCTIKHFSIGEDPAIPTDTLPTVTICAGDCFNFFGQMICSDSMASHIENCTLFVRQILVDPGQSTYLGVVGSVSCAQPCFNFHGVDYCNPGSYTRMSGQCDTEIFEITFEKETQQLGQVGIITCADPCFTFEGVEYCQPGNFTVEDSCTIQYFSIGQNTSLPQTSLPEHHCLPNNTQFTVAFSITGQPPYKVNTNVISGSSYQSPPIFNGSTYVFVVEQANGCQTVVNGSYDCAASCSTDAGKLSSQLLEGCAGQSTLEIQSLTAVQAATNDVVEYWLQTSSGDIIDRMQTTIIGFKPAIMSAETMYQVRRAVGPPDPLGHPDITNPCTDTSSAQPLIFHALPTVQLASQTMVCGGDLLTIQASGAASYTWPDGTVAEQWSQLAPNTSQVATYAVQGIDLHGCADTATIDVTIIEAPVVDEVALHPPLCPGDNNGKIDIIATHGGLEPLSFALNNGSFSAARLFENLAPGVYVVHVQDAFGCDADSLYTLPEPQPATLDIGPDQHIQLGNITSVVAKPSSTPASIEWTSDNGMNLSGSLEWTLQPLRDMLVRCEIVDSNGCVARDEALILVEIAEGIYRPNVLMLGASQTDNNYFTLYSAQGWIKSIVSMRIYDRWGEQLWQNHDFPANTPAVGWDGSFKGSPASPGVYVYVAEVELADGTRQMFKGDVTLVR